jgi:CyaY protein
MSTDETDFRHLVASALKNLSQQVDAIDSDDFDSRLADGVFQVDWEEGGTFVLSQQVPVRELWLSAFSKAWHFRHGDGGWKERDSGEPLEKILSAHFTKRMGRPVVIRSPG